MQRQPRRTPDLRKHGEKQMLLIELVTRGTVEEFITERRRQHHAYL
jgi:hypothetical protein